MLVAKLEAADGGLPFKLPPRRPSDQQHQQENGDGAIVVANEVITASLVDFTSVEVRAAVTCCACMIILLGRLIDKLPVRRENTLVQTQSCLF